MQQSDHGPLASKPKMFVALDSGAFSAWSKGEEIDIDDYCEFIHECIPLLQVYFNLDVIGDGEKSYKNWEYMRDKGLDPLGVYHLGTPGIYRHNYLTLEPDYLALSGTPARKYKDQLESFLQRQWDYKLMDSSGYPLLKVHGFGITSAKLVEAYPWHSVDSSTWAQYAGKYGKICVPKLSPSGGYEYTNSPHVVPVSWESRHVKTHIDNLPTYKRNPLLRYIQKMGFTLGKGHKDDPTRTPGLCNDVIMRHQLNAIFYSQMGKALETRIYLADNYDALGKIEQERRIRDAVFAQGLDYYRLISFADYPEIKSVLNLKEEELIHATKSKRKSIGIGAKNPGT